MSARLESPGTVLLHLAARARRQAAEHSLAGEVLDELRSAVDALAASGNRLDLLELVGIELARLDAQQLLDALDGRTGGAPAEVVLPALVSRFGTQAHELARAASKLPTPLTNEAVRDGEDSALMEVAAEYGEDRKAELRAARARRAAAAACLAGAVATAIWAVHLADTSKAALWAALTPPLLLCAVAALAGLLLLRAAAAHDKAAREYARLQRGLATLGPYLAPLPPDARHLLRAMMAQTLFQRQANDDDIGQEPAWPDSREMHYAVHGLEPSADEEPS